MSSGDHQIHQHGAFQRQHELVWRSDFYGHAHFWANKWLYSNDFPRDMPRAECAISWLALWARMKGRISAWNCMLSDMRSSKTAIGMLDFGGQRQAFANHLSAAVPGYSDRFLVIPYGLLWCLGISLELACETYHRGR